MTMNGSIQLSGTLHDETQYYGTSIVLSRTITVSAARLSITGLNKMTYRNNTHRNNNMPYGTHHNEIEHNESHHNYTQPYNSQHNATKQNYNQHINSQWHSA
jgi:hypothetical protein